MKKMKYYKVFFRRPDGETESIIVLGENEDMAINHAYRALRDAEANWDILKIERLDKIIQ